MARQLVGPEDRVDPACAQARQWRGHVPLPGRPAVVTSKWSRSGAATRSRGRDLQAELTGAVETLGSGETAAAQGRGGPMKRILITGMSGTGKSAVIRELKARGFDAHDLDTPDWSHWVDADPSDALTPVPGKDWVWREERVRALLLRPRREPLFVGGSADNMGEFLCRIAEVVLMSAPVEAVRARLGAGPAGAYGAGEDDRRKVRELIATIEPRLRGIASHEVDSRGSI